jgi:hypothetical protein
LRRIDRWHCGILREPFDRSPADEAAASGDNDNVLFSPQVAAPHQKKIRPLLSEIFDERCDREHEDDYDEDPDQGGAAHHPARPLHHHLEFLRRSVIELEWARAYP